MKALSAGGFFPALALFSILTVLFVAGCPAHEDNPGSLSIGVVLKCSSNPFFQEIEKGIRETAEKNNVKVAVISPEQRDANEQVRILERMVDLNVDALLFTPEGKTLSIPSIARAHRKNIPVILLDTGVDETLAEREGAHYECVITSANEQGGELAGRYIAERLSRKGKVLVMPGDVESYAGEKRIKGFMKIMESHPQLKVITAPAGDFARTKAFDISKEIFRKHQDIKGVFALNDMMAIGISDALESLKLKRMCIVGFDATEVGTKAILDHRIDATITQYPYDIGKIGVESVLKLKKGESLSPLIFTRTELVTRERLLMPFESK